MKSFRALAAFALSASIGTIGGLAQSPAAAPSSFESTISGRVMVQGLAVPGVTVTVTDPASGQKYVTSTDERGRFIARVAHAGTFAVATVMAAFAPSQAEVVVPASGAAPTPLAINLTLVSNVTAATATSNAPARTTERPGRASGAAAPNAGRSTVAANGRAGRGQGQAGRGGSRDNNFSGFQQLDVTQTGDLSGDTGA
ncbi:MAG: carboxypeptidase-like regulatory domain-containing protein, partial [Terriglobales bacterium]